MLSKKYIIIVAIILAVVGAILWLRDNFGNTNATKKAETPSEIVKKFVQQPQATELKPEESRIIPGKVIATVIDQHGNLLGGKDFFPISDWGGKIVDALGEQVIWASIKNGYFESNKSLPPGEYTIFVPDCLTPHCGSYDLTSVVKKFQLPAEGINLGKLTIMRLASVKVRVINEVGTELIGAYYLITNYNGQTITLDRPFLLLGGNGGLFGNDLGAYLGDHFPAGNYTVRILKDGYISTEKSFEVKNSDVDLGDIVLKKK